MGASSRGVRRSVAAWSPLPCWGDVWAPEQERCDHYASWAVIGPDMLDDGQVVIVVAGACDRHVMATRVRFSEIEPAVLMSSQVYAQRRAEVERQSGGELYELRKVA